MRSCTRLLAGDSLDAYPEMAWLAGANTSEWLASPVNAYWPRVWAARVFLYAWLPFAGPFVVSGLSDDAWRVREMCAKVARLRDLGEAGDALSTLVSDSVPRVRVAAIRALALVGEAEHAAAITDAQDDPESTVRDAARKALREMESRLDRPL